MSRAQILDYEFEKFIAQNPEVWHKFRTIALKLKAKGIDRWGAKAIWEVLRYELALKAVTTGESHALNNNHTSRFARKLMEEEEFHGFFELRTLKSGETATDLPSKPH